MVMEKYRLNLTFSKLKCIFSQQRCAVTVSGANSGNNNFNSSFKSHHLEISPVQKILLGFGSAVVSLANPTRGDMIAAMGETTGLKALAYVRGEMANSTEGSRILKEKPRITSTTVNLKKLGKLNDGTVGKTYYNFMKKYNYSPDARLTVQFVDDVELAFVIQRYREVHDLFHAILNMPTNMLGEVTVKWVEGIQTRLPMCVGGAIFGAARLAPKYTRMYSTMSRVNLTLDPKTDENLDNGLKPKKHPGIIRLPSISVPSTIQQTIDRILRERQIPDIAIKAKNLKNYLNSRKPPSEEGDIKAERKKIFAEICNQLDFKDESIEVWDVEYVKRITQANANKIVNSKIYNWSPSRMDDAMSYVYLAARAAPDYAVIFRLLNEIRKRDPDFRPRNLFDFGSGIGTVSWAAHSLWQDTIKEYYTVDSSKEVNDLALRILQNGDTQAEPFTKELYQRQFLPSTPRAYDLVVSSYSLLELPDLKSRLQVINRLWQKTGKYLVFAENGSLASFKVLDEARSFILHSSEKWSTPCHVFAPCPHEHDCPRLNSLDGTPCNFEVSHCTLDTPLLGKRKSLFERFSYLIMAKTERSDNWPRIVREVLRRHHHSVCRLCTSQGKLAEAVLTKSKHGKNLYKCSRYSSWGDLFPGTVSGDEK